MRMKLLREMSYEQRPYCANTKLGDIINGQRQTLSVIIDTEYGLLNELLALRVLTREQYETIESLTINYFKVDKLLDYVIRLSLVQQKQFLLALFKTGQSHINNFIIANGSRTEENDENWPLVDDPKAINMLDERNPILIELLDVKNGLLDELLSVGCINTLHKQAIENENKDAHQKNELLLKIMLRRSIGDYSKFIGCLTKTKQHQVAYLLGAKLQPGHEPLTEVQKSMLVRNRSSLVELIDTERGLIAEMYAAGCITWRQKDFIETPTSKAERNIRLLNLMEKSCQLDFNKFMKCLKATGQKHVCRLLSPNAAVAIIVAKTSGSHTLLYIRNKSLISDCDAGNVKTNETLIVERIMASVNNVPDDHHTDELKHEVVRFVRKLRDRGLLPAAAKRRSIVLYLLCTSLTELFHLEERYSSGILKTVLGYLFTVLLDSGQCVTERHSNFQQ
jgi:hypothetical protein